MRNRFRRNGRRALLLTAFVALVATVAVAAIGADTLRQNDEPEELANTSDRPLLHASWVRRANSIDEAVGQSQVGVLGVVEGVRTGEPLTGKAADDVTPTQLIDIKVTKTLFGSASQRIVLFKTGDNQTWIEGDPPYAVGEKYLLLLTPRLGPDGKVERDTFIPSSPDARIKLDGTKPTVLIEGKMKSDLQGKSTDGLVSSVEGADNAR